MFMFEGHSAVCRSVLQCVAVCCSVLQYVYEFSAVVCKAFRKVRAIISAVAGTAVQKVSCIVRRAFRKVGAIVSAVVCRTF